MSAREGLHGADAGRRPQANPKALRSLAFLKAFHPLHRLNVRLDEQVPHAAPVRVGHPLAAEREDVARLRAARNGKFAPAAERGRSADKTR